MVKNLTVGYIRETNSEKLQPKWLNEIMLSPSSKTSEFKKKVETSLIWVLYTDNLASQITLKLAIAFSYTYIVCQKVKVKTGAHFLHTKLYNNKHDMMIFGGPKGCCRAKSLQIKVQ